MKAASWRSIQRRAIDERVSLVSDEGTSPDRPRRRGEGGGSFSDQLTAFRFLLMVVMLLGIVLYPYMVVNVPSGHVGVLWKRFRGGTVLDPRR